MISVILIPPVKKTTNESIAQMTRLTRRALNLNLTKN